MYWGLKKIPRTLTRLCSIFLPTCRCNRRDIIGWKENSATLDTTCSTLICTEYCHQLVDCRWVSLNSSSLICVLFIRRLRTAASGTRLDKVFS